MSSHLVHQMKLDNGVASYLAMLGGQRDTVDINLIVEPRHVGERLQRKLPSSLGWEKEEAAFRAHICDLATSVRGLSGLVCVHVRTASRKKSCFVKPQGDVPTVYATFDEKAGVLRQSSDPDVTASRRGFSVICHSFTPAPFRMDDPGMGPPISVIPISPTQLDRLERDLAAGELTEAPAFPLMAAGAASPFQTKTGPFGRHPPPLRRTVETAAQNGSKAPKASHCASLRLTLDY